MTLAAPGRFEPTRQLDARVTLLPSARRLKHRAKAHFHQGATETIAEIHLLGAPDRITEIAPGNSALAQLRLADPLLLLPGDRFILRQFSPVVTIGGGIVLDALAPRHRARGTSALPLLTAFECAVQEESASDEARGDVLAALAESTPAGFTLGALVARTGWAERDIRFQAEKLEQAARLRIVSQQPFVVAAPAALEACAARILKEVERFHRANPLVEAVSKENLRERTASQVRPEVFRSALDDLARAQKITLSGDLVKRAGHAISLLPEEIRAKEQIEQEFARAGLTVPAVKDVLAKLPVESRRAQKLLQLLLREGTLLRVSDQLIFHRSAIEHLTLQLAEYKRVRGDRLPISAFKELAGGSRKYAIPLLEYLDKEQVTRRVGDDRVIL